MAKETGWTVDYILHGVNYQTLIMMLSDAGRWVEGKSGDRAGTNGTNRTNWREQTAEEEAETIAGLFISKLQE